MMDNKLQILLILCFTMGGSLAKPAGYDYQPNEDLERAQPQYNYQQQVNYAPVQETYKKEFYIFSAPEEDFEDVHASHKIASSVQKNVRVVFIRAPEQKGLEHAALQLAKQVSDDKTAIYVLNKQHDLGELAQRLTAYREQYVQKPEVHFVKYRTPAEAEHAQQQIQSHYNSLRGSTHTSNEGAAPVLDFSSKPPATYGSAISVVPAYNVGNAGLYNPQLLNTAYKTINSNSISSSSSGGNDGGSSGLYNQQLLTNTQTEPNNLSQQSNEYEKAQANLALLNLLSTYKTQSQSFKTNTVSSSSIGGYSTIGDGDANYGGDDGNSSSGNVVAGLASLGLGPSSVDKGAGYGLEAFGVSPRNVESNQQQLVEPAIARMSNERQQIGAKLVFPSDGGFTNTYLPPKKRQIK